MSYYMTPMGFTTAPEQTKQLWQAVNKTGSWAWNRKEKIPTLTPASWSLKSIGQSIFNGLSITCLAGSLGSLAFFFFFWELLQLTHAICNEMICWKCEEVEGEILCSWPLLTLSDFPECLEMYLKNTKKLTSWRKSRPELWHCQKDGRMGFWICFVILKTTLSN